MAQAILIFLVSAAAIVLAGSFLTRFADAIAEATGLGKLLVGSILLAGATSLPELTVDISAVRMQMADLAVGDLLGSCLMNLLILAMLDLTHRSRGKMLSRQSAAHALSGMVGASLMCVVAIGLATAHSLSSPPAAFGFSPALIVVVVGYILGIRLVYLDQQIARQAAPIREEYAPGGETNRLRNAVLGFAACAGVILLAGPYLAESAGELAERSGLGKTFVGTTLVAFCTSLPELAATIAALRMGSFDLAIGNVFGSNAFNVLLLFVLDLVHPGPLLAAVSPKHVITCLAAALATQIAVMGQLYNVERRRKLIEPDAWLLIAVALVSLGLIYYLPS